MGQWPQWWPVKWCHLFLGSKENEAWAISRYYVIFGRIYLKIVVIAWIIVCEESLESREDCSSYSTVHTDTILIAIGSQELAIFLSNLNLISSFFHWEDVRHKHLYRRSDWQYRRSICNFKLRCMYMYIYIYMYASAMHTAFSNGYKNSHIFID